MPQRGDDDKHFVFSSRGIDPYDKPNTIYVERHEPSGYSTVFRSTDFFQSRENLEVILEEVRDFQLRDKYMFANIKLRVTDEKKEREETTFEHLLVLLLHQGAPWGHSGGFPSSCWSAGGWMGM